MKAAHVSLRLGQRPLGLQIHRAGLLQLGRGSLLLFLSKEGSKNCLHFCPSNQVSLSYVQQAPPNITQRLRFQELLLFYNSYHNRVGSRTKLASLRRNRSTVILYSLASWREHMPSLICSLHHNNCGLWSSL